MFTVCDISGGPGGRYQNSSQMMLVRRSGSRIIFLFGPPGTMQTSIIATPGRAQELEMASDGPDLSVADV